ncbi:hypothetical protein BST61_g4170 [Cercospora zeina]
MKRKTAANAASVLFMKRFLAGHVNEEEQRRRLMKETNKDLQENAVLEKGIATEMRKNGAMKIEKVHMTAAADAFDVAGQETNRAKNCKVDEPQEPLGATHSARKGKGEGANLKTKTKPMGKAFSDENPLPQFSAPFRDEDDEEIFVKMELSSSPCSILSPSRRKA